MEHIRSKTKDYGSEDLSLDRLDLDHFLDRLDLDHFLDRLALALAFLFFHFGSNDEKPDSKACPVSTIYPFISQEIRTMGFTFYIMEERRNIA